MKMTKALTTAMIIGAFSLSAGLVQAGDVPARGPVSFATYDADGNGSINEQEYNNIREQRQAAAKDSGRMGRGMANAPSFTDADTNKDGQISTQELQTMQEKQQANRGMGKGKEKGQGGGPRK